MGESHTYDTIVVGLGAMGSATLLHLARRGQHVLGLEQFTPGHTLGSSHGDSRIIRETYFEHPQYVPLVQRAHELWRDLEETTGTSLMRINGGLMIGPPDGMLITGTLRSAREHHLAHEVLSPDEVLARYPAFELAANLVAVLDPRAGYLDPEACIRAHLEGARLGGASTRFDETMLSWAPDGDGLRITTSRATYLSERLVLAAGPWTCQLAPELGLPLAIERQTVFWFEPDARISYDEQSFPIYAYEFKPGTLCYGFPRMPRGVKASIMHDGASVSDPLNVVRTVGDTEVDALRIALRPILPSLADARVRETAVCLFTNTPDHDFLIDFHPRNPRVLISSPCSGHGFKFASAIGELQADLLIDGTTRFDLSPFSLSRWSDARVGSARSPAS
ncbi:MAG: N-methyl-L-tryptophan oxidase [Gemmatimonadaceae bacterium]